jgi:hypothetical protein
VCKELVDQSNLGKRHSDQWVLITLGAFKLTARLEWEAAPLTCAALLKILPLQNRHLLHVRWSGEAVWVPMNLPEWSLKAENATRYPIPGQVLVYADALSEPELLISYGPTAFASKAGALAGNHALTIIKGAELLPAIGRSALWEGALTATIDTIDPDR